MSSGSISPSAKHAKYTGRLSSVTDNNISEKTAHVKGDPVIREINQCLMPCDQCTGIYIDNIGGNIVRIICHHYCHASSLKDNNREAVRRSEPPKPLPEPESIPSIGWLGNLMKMKSNSAIQHTR
jgi:hypothetical protein